MLVFKGVGLGVCKGVRGDGGVSVGGGVGMGASVGASVNVREWVW